MKIVIAPDSFKESLSAEKCCQAIKAGFSTCLLYTSDAADEL